jgi:hypothetical protein
MVLGLIGVVLAGGCVADPVIGPAPSAEPTTSAAVTPVDELYRGDLVALVVPRPATAGAPPAGTTPDGPLDTGGAAKIFYHDQVVSGAAYLLSLGFDRGAFGAWRDATGTLVAIELFAFDTNDHAVTWGIQTQSGLEGAAGEVRTARFGAIATGRWYEFHPAAGTVRLDAIFFKGSIGAYVSVQAGIADLDRLTSLAEEQAGRLP